MNIGKTFYVMATCIAMLVAVTANSEGVKTVIEEIKKGKASEKTAEKLLRRIANWTDSRDYLTSKNYDKTQILDPEILINALKALDKSDPELSEKFGKSVRNVTERTRIKDRDDTPDDASHLIYNYNLA